MVLVKFVPYTVWDHPMLLELEDLVDDIMHFTSTISIWKLKTPPFFLFSYELLLNEIF